MVPDRGALQTGQENKDGSKTIHDASRDVYTSKLARRHGRLQAARSQGYVGSGVAAAGVAAPSVCAGARHIIRHQNDVCRVMRV